MPLQLGLGTHAGTEALFKLLQIDAEAFGDVRPSTLAVPAMGRERRLAANARAAAKERRAQTSGLPVLARSTTSASLHRPRVQGRRAGSVGRGALGRSAPLLRGRCGGFPFCVSLMAAWLARRIRRRDESSVDCKLDTAPRRQMCDGRQGVRLGQ